MYYGGSYWYYGRLLPYKKFLIMDERTSVNSPNSKLSYSDTSHTDTDNPRTDHMDYKVNPSSARFPHSIVWTPLPVITLVV